MAKPDNREIARVRRHAERSSPDKAAGVLAEGLVAHVGIVENGRPFVLPMNYHFDRAQPGRIYLHGDPAGRLMKYLSSGAPVCIAVTLLDGLVYSRSAQYHSVNYRSVVCFGRGSLVEDQAAKSRIFDEMIARYFPGRAPGVDYAPATSEQLKGTAIVEVRIEQISAKMREGGPQGPLDSDPNALGSCGVVDFTALPL